MKLTNKATLTALTKSCAKDDARFYLNGIHFGPEKMTATNGHMLLQCGYLEMDTDEFPFRGSKPTCDGTDDTIVPLSAVTSALRNCKKNSLPIIDNTLVVSRDAKAVQLLTSDLSAEQTTKAEAVKGNYPDTTSFESAPKGENGKAQEGVDIGIQPDYLIALGQAAKAIGAKAVKLTVYNKDTYLRIEAGTGNDQPDLTGAIMPMRY